MLFNKKRQPSEPDIKRNEFEQPSRLLSELMKLPLSELPDASLGIVMISSKQIGLYINEFYFPVLIYRIGSFYNFFNYQGRLCMGIKITERTNTFTKYFGFGKETVPQSGVFISSQFIPAFLYYDVKEIKQVLKNKFMDVHCYTMKYVQ